jgi:hypothetical protein
LSHGDALNPGRSFPLREGRGAEEEGARTHIKKRRDLAYHPAAPNKRTFLSVSPGEVSYG